MSDASSTLAVAGLAVTAVNLIVGLLAIAAVVWKGGRMSQQLDTVAKTMDRHDSDIRGLLVAKGESTGHRHALASYHEGEG